MNSFLDLHSDVDYRNNNRPYYTGTWEYTNVSSDYLIPWQYRATDPRADLEVYSIDTDGAETDITSYFYGSNLITSWTKTGTGTWSSTGPNILTGTTVTNDIQTSNSFSLTAGEAIYIEFDDTKYTAAADYDILLKKAAATVASFNMSGGQNKIWHTVAATGADYTIVIDYGGAGGSVQGNSPVAYVSTIYDSGSYRWYNGGQLTGTLSGVFRLKVGTSGGYFFSDWCDTCGFDDKTKIKLSSTKDYGGIKYVAGYEQFMYKDATVRRSPKAEIEITGDKLNGAIIEEKKVAAIRYKITMKCTEAEYEGLVHAMGGVLEITDQTGKVYSAVNIELSDATWYRSNGVTELSFVDDNNISIFTRNNSNL